MNPYNEFYSLFPDKETKTDAFIRVIGEFIDDKELAEDEILETIREHYHWYCMQIGKTKER